MNEEFIREIIKSTISGEPHLGTNLKEQCLKYFYNLISENQQLKEKLEASEKARKEAIEYIKTNPLYEEKYDYNYDDELELLGINSEQAKYDLLDILDIDKGE